MWKMSRRVQWSIFGSLVLAMAVGRCSPIAPSVPKSTLRSGAKAAIPPSVGGEVQQQTQKVQTRVVTFALPEPKDLLSENALRIAPEQMDQLRKNGKLELPVQSAVIRQPVAFLKPAGVFALDTAALASLEITLLYGSTWSLKVKDPKDVLSGIEGILLVLDVDSISPEILVPAPEASSVPSEPAREPAHKKKLKPKSVL